MLSQFGIYDRRWGRFPFLGTVLDVKWQEFEDSFYLTSISESEFDQLHRVLFTAALVSASPDALRAAVMAAGDEDERARRADALERDIYHLREALSSAEEYVRRRREELEKAAGILRWRPYEDLAADHGTTHG